MGNKFCECGRGGDQLGIENPGQLKRNKKEIEEFKQIELTPVVNGPDETNNCTVSDVIVGKKAIIVVNTSDLSSGDAKVLTALQALYDELSSQGLQILVFPSSQYLGRDAKMNFPQADAIKEFAE